MNTAGWHPNWRREFQERLGILTEKHRQLSARTCTLLLSARTKIQNLRDRVYEIEEQMRKG